MMEINPKYYSLKRKWLMVMEAVYRSVVFCLVLHHLCPILPAQFEVFKEKKNKQNQRESEKKFTSSPSCASISFFEDPPKAEPQVDGSNGSTDPLCRSPQLDEPVEDEEDETAEEQHVAEQFGLAAS